MNLSEDPGCDASAKLAELLAADQATRAAAATADQWLETFRRTARVTLSEPELDDLVRAALVAIARMLHADAAALMLADEDGSALVGRAGYGLAHELDLELSVQAGTGLTGPILATGEPRMVDDLSAYVEETNPLRVAGLHSFIGVALRSGQRVLGVLYAARRRVEPFGGPDVEVAEFLAGPIAAAIERVELFRAERLVREVAERALGEARRATQRVRSLQRITAALVGASTVAEICELILGEAVREFTDGLGHGAIWMLRESHLVLVAGGGRSAEYGEIPLDDSLPAAENLSTGEPLFVESQDEMRKRWPALAHAGTPSFAGLPLIIDGRRLGLMAVGYREEHTFAPDEREYLAALAEQAATALARAEAETALSEARRLAEKRREQLAFLAEASERLGQSLDLEITLSTVAQLSVPLLTDRCALYLLEDREVTRRVLAPNLSPDEWRLFQDSTISTSASSGVGAVLRTGQPEYAPDIDDAMLVGSAESPERLELLRRIGFGGMVILPLRARGRVLGALALVNRAGRPMPEGDRALGEELAARAAMAIDNALLYGRQAHVAGRLAESLMPARLPEIGGLDLAARYEPMSRGLDIGGDFYDVSAMGDGAWLVVIGDVQERASRPQRSPGSLATRCGRRRSARRARRGCWDTSTRRWCATYGRPRTTRLIPGTAPGCAPRRWCASIRAWVAGSPR